jgi:hypothetical protein
MKEDRQMHDLVKLTIDAHGGLEQWAQVSRISAAFTVSGLGFKQRGPIGEAFAALPARLWVDTHIQQTIIEPFVAQGQKGIYQPFRTAIESSDGVLIEELNHPRDSLKTIPLGTPWSALQVLYFVGYAFWMYFTLPFSFLMDGVKCETDGFVVAGVLPEITRSFHVGIGADRKVAKC